MNKLKDRLEKFIEPIPFTDCIIWGGSSIRGGYGRIRINGKLLLAHRVSWQIRHNKQIPNGMSVCHSCDNPRCINPNHLWLGTHKENIQDSSKKGRQKGGTKYLTDKCKRGHLFSQTAYFYKSGKRACRQCIVDKNRIWKRKNRAAQQKEAIA